MKNTYSINDLCELLGKPRLTIFRWRKNGVLPLPDIGGKANPIWFKATLDKHLSNLTTSPSA